MELSPTHSPAPHVILVVEDELLVRMAAGEALEDAGFTVLEAGDAQEAIEILERNHRSVRVMFTDVQMPGTLDGIDLAHHTCFHWPWIGILIVSGQVRQMLRSVPIGSRFLAKPYDVEDVLQHIRHFSSH